MNDLDTQLQQALQTFYRIDEGPPVAIFRIGRAVLEGMFGDKHAQLRETLIVAQDGDETLLSLFICDEVMMQAGVFFARLSEADDSSHLDAFCVALEGVSHFVYFTYCGQGQDRPVSQVELELQAEIDKYLVLRLVLGLAGDDLIDTLFERFELASHLLPEEAERYRVANRAGRRYARWLDRQITKGRAHAAIEDARRLYRKPMRAKMAHIARAA